MIINIRDSKQTFNNIEVTIPVWRSIVQLSGDNLPTEPKDFDVINEEGTIVDYFEGFSVLYDKGENYIQFTNDTNIYYNYLITDENGYIIRTEISTEKLDEFLYQSGQGKKYKEFSMNLYDENGFSLYKIEGEKLVEISDEEREYAKKEKIENEFSFVVENKTTELSIICGQVITAGTDVTLSNGTKHYSFTSNDQNNIKNWFDVAVSTKVDGIPYHADGEECELYTYLDIIQLYIAEQKYILYHNTYFNMLKAMVKTMTSIEEVTSVVYGMELNEEFSEKMNTILAQSEEVFAKAMAAYGIHVNSISL